MAKKNNPEEKFETKYLSTKLMLIARALVGAYLVYTSYSLIDGVINGEGRDVYFLGVFMAAFALIGILLMVFAGRDLLRGKYVGGELDAGEGEEKPSDSAGEGEKPSDSVGEGEKPSDSAGE